MIIYPDEVSSAELSEYPRDTAVLSHTSWLRLANRVQVDFTEVAEDCNIVSKGAA
jgi:hypothetical protein